LVIFAKLFSNNKTVLSMARQVGPLFITGTIDGIIFYKLDDQYYLRSKGDYQSGKQMRKDKRLKRTMEKADQFGEASKLTQSVYYRHLPKALRKHGLFGKLTGLVNGWLQEGKSVEEARELLIAHCQQLVAQFSKAAPTPTLPPQPTPATTPTSKPTEVKPIVAKPLAQSKQARYLSRWKVRRNGRLQVPRTVREDCKLHAVVASAEDGGTQRRQGAKTLMENFKWEYRTRNKE
jgi:hypothetical protein